jgi:2-(1,2-epoxy-1,2-dihydrophenyl)acetyl-CoA isomerase
MTITNTGTDPLLAALDGGVLTLTMNRPEARNAMSGEMNAALGVALASKRRVS